MIQGFSYGGTNYNCNAKVTSSDSVGYVGGQHGSYLELDNWYYWDF